MAEPARDHRGFVLLLDRLEPAVPPELLGEPPPPLDDVG